MEGYVTSPPPKKTATEETGYDFNLLLIMFILKKVDDSNPLNFFQ